MSIHQKTLLLIFAAAFWFSAILVHADYQAGLSAYECGDYETAMKEFKQLAKQGDAKGQHKLGVMYTLGQGVPQNYTEAERLFRLAAEQGNAKGQYNLGVMYALGHGVQQNDIEAVRWFRLAAEQGDAKAKTALGDLHNKVEGKPQDEKEAKPTVQEIAKKAFGSTVLLVMEDAKGQPFSFGSGFIVRDGAIASNLHVVEGATRGYAKLVGQKVKYDIEGITAIDPNRDLVVLKISADRLPAISFGNSDSVEVGASVYAVGNPRGLEGTFSTGIVSSIREVGIDKLLQITAPISPGSSGGPVLNGKGKVIGVSVATFRGGQNLNFAIPSNYLKMLLAKTGPVKPLAQLKSAQTPSSILADLGGRSSDGVAGVDFRWNDSFSGGYSLSFRNQLRENVKNVYCLVIFYDVNGNPIDVDVIVYGGLIPAGLAKRVTSDVDSSVQKLTPNIFSPKFRILDFEITS